MNLLIKALISISLIVCLTSNIYSQEKNNILKIKIEGMKYNQLCLRIGLDNGKLLAIDGQSENKQDWIFSYPDSVYEKMKYKFLFVKDPDSIMHRLAFKVMSNRDTLKFGEFSFKRNCSVINLQYMKTTITAKSWQTQNKTYISDLFSVKDPIDPQLMAVGKCLTYGYSMFAYDSLTDKQRFQKYINLVKEFPYSEYAISMLSGTLTRYQTKDDVRKIFSCFNEDVRNSYYGKKVSAYITDETFKNSVLRSWNSEVNESIIIDTTKYTLVLFSASWCAPCHELIPILKEIYKDQLGKLDMVYISIDESATVENWKEMMKEEHIPWRSLMAVDSIKEIRDKYFVEGVPYSILVYPDGRMGKINVRHKEEVDKLYKLLQ
ncbi:MAG: thioredoxin-like domain-containing protein [Bacteroidia bacterium]|nr:thioredoxin-like domain-containing protein [Bacteroidia bacterium]